jgi:hypothetical protein
MSRSNQRLTVPAAITVVAVGVIALIASGVLRPSPVSGTPPASPSAPAWVPSVPPAQPTQAPATPAPATPAPSVDPDGEPDNITTIDLDVATPHDVRVTVVDEIAALVAARAGRAGDGMSVRWYDLKVENLDASTLRLTWVGFAADEEAVLKIGELDGKVELTLIQPGPPPNSDALGFDRVLVVQLAQPVNAADVLYSVQGSVDTAD